MNFSTTLWFIGSPARARRQLNSIGKALAVARDASSRVDTHGCNHLCEGYFRTSERFASRVFTNIVYWKDKEEGGHFAAFEQPNAFVSELRECFASCLNPIRFRRRITPRLQLSLDALAATSVIVVHGPMPGCPVIPKGQRTFLPLKTNRMLGATDMLV